MAEAGKGLEFLAGRKEVAANKVGVIGFCMGGRFTFLANAVHADKFKGAVAFYGGGIANPKDQLGRKPLLDRVQAMRSPIMLNYGADDESIPAEEHERIAEALSQAKNVISLGFSQRRTWFYERSPRQLMQLLLHKRHGI
jgi:carboxymethylenebutenolidase